MKRSEFYNDYKRARDKSWEIMIKYQISALPVQMLELCERMGIYAVSYDRVARTIKTHNLTEYTINNDGFSTIINGHYVIFYDNTIQPRGRLKFTLAHELGHIVLGHLLKENISCRNGVSVWNIGESKEPNELEAAANIFASRLLAPACVLWALNIHAPGDISNLCGLSETAAKVRADRMELLYKRNKFLTSPLERQIYDNFKDFIKQKKER